MKTELVPRPAGRRWEGVGLLAMAAAVAAALGVWDPHGSVVGVGIAVAGFGIAGATRAFGGRSARSIEFLPGVVVLGYLAVVAPISLVTDLLAGVGALALFAWLADDPDRPRGNLRRSGDVLLLPALGLAVAVTSSLLIPPGPVYVGAATALLVAGLLAIAWVLSHPGSFDTPETPTI